MARANAAFPQDLYDKITRAATKFFKLQGRFSAVDPDLLEQLRNGIKIDWKWLKRFMKQ